MRVSKGMLSGYRNGKHPISGKAWRKLEEIERSENEQLSERAVPSTGNSPERRSIETMIAQAVFQSPEMMDAIAHNLRDLLSPVLDRIGVIEKKIDSLAATQIPSDPGERARAMREAMEDLPPSPITHPELREGSRKKKHA